MSESTPTGGGAPPPRDRPSEDRPRGDRPYGDRPPGDRGDRPFGDRPGGGPGGRGPGRGRPGDRERRPLSVKGRLRAKARKKARKAMKKKGAFRKKLCRFCADANLEIDYKDPKGLRYFVTETGKLIPQRISGNCAKHQRQVALAIKRSRQLAMMPYAPHHVG